jgi:hypothetical protein
MNFPKDFDMPEGMTYDYIWDDVAVSFLSAGYNTVGFMVSRIR